jgi:hypothetical protein
MPLELWASKGRLVTSRWGKGGPRDLGRHPLENISIARRAETVIRGGVIYDCAVLWRSVGSHP